MKTPYILNDYDVMDILENLSLKEKLSLRTVSKQFNECVNRVLKSQKVLNLFIKDIDRDPFREYVDFVYDLEIKEILSEESVQVLDMNQIKEQFEPILRRFHTLTVLKLRLNTSNNWYFEWLANIFPHLKSIEISFIREDNWDNNKLLTFKAVLGPKCQHLKTNDFNNIQELIESEVMKLPSVRSIDFECDEEFIDSSLEDIFNNLTPNIRSISFCSDNPLENNRVLEALISGNGKYIEKLNIKSYATSFGNQMLRMIFRDIPGINTLCLNCKYVSPLESLRYAKNLEELTFTDNFSIDSQPILKFPTDYTLVLTKVRKLEFTKTIVYPDFCQNIEKSFPNIEYVSLDSFKMCCRCASVSRVCFDCYKQFLIVCKKVYERKIDSKNKSLIKLIYSPIVEKVIVFMAIIEEFFESKQSLNMKIDCILTEQMNRKIINQIYSLSMLAIIQTAYRKPEIHVCFKVGSDIYRKIESNYQHILPSNMKLEVVDKEYVLENERNDENKSCIHLYRTRYGSDSDESYIVLKLGSNTSITKRIKLSFDYYINIQSMLNF